MEWVNLQTAVSIVRSVASAACNAWTSATGGRVTFTETTDPDQAHITIIFVQLQYGVGGNTQEPELDINSHPIENADADWTDDPNMVTADNIPDIYTIVLHEFGHVFLGGGHPTSGSSPSVMNIQQTQVKRSLTNCDGWMTLNIYDPVMNITFSNSFAGGVMDFNNGSGYVQESLTNGAVTKSWRESTFPHQVRAHTPQTFASHDYDFGKWQSSTNGGTLWGDVTFSTELSALSTIGAYNAWFAKVLSLQIGNDLPGSSSAGTVKVNGSDYSAPVSNFHVHQLDTLHLEATSQSIQRVLYTFSFWTSSATPPDTFRASQWTVYPNDDLTYTAHYAAKPEPPDNIQPQGSGGENPTLVWDEHPNPNVQKYQIWRVEKPLGGQPGPATMLAELNRGTRQFTDYDYIITSSYTSNLVSYDVRSVLILNSTRYYSDPVWYAYFARIEIAMKADSSKMGAKATSIQDDGFGLAFGPYPNPFNPSTTIRFSTDGPGYVNLTIYDMLGRSVATLVDGNLPAGQHSAVWNADRLTSGIYFCRLSTQVEGRGLISKTIRLVLTK